MFVLYHICAHVCTVVCVWVCLSVSYTLICNNRMCPRSYTSLGICGSVFGSVR